MKEGPGKRDILSRPASKKAAARPRSAPRNEPKPVPVPLPEGVRHQRAGKTTDRSAHLEKLKQLFEAAPISRYLGLTLNYCENGVARVRLPFRAEFEERHGRLVKKFVRHFDRVARPEYGLTRPCYTNYSGSTRLRVIADQYRNRPTILRLPKMNTASRRPDRPQNQNESSVPSRYRTRLSANAAKKSIELQ